MNKTPLILIFTILIISCKQKEFKGSEIFIKNFEKTYKLKGEIILKKDKSGIAIYVIDSLLLVQSKGTNVHYNIYSKKTQKHLGSLGVKGDSPDAWIFGFYSGQYLVENDSIKVWFSDHPKGKFMRVNLTENITKKTNIPLVDKKFNINTNIFPFDKLFYSNDSTLFASSGYIDEKRARLKKYNPVIEKASYSTLAPTVKNLRMLSTDEQYKLYHSTVAKKPGANLFVSALRHFSRLDIIDENLNIVKSIESKGVYSNNQLDIKELNIKDKGLQELKLYYKDCFASSKYIYTLYYSQTEEEYGENLIPTEIRVFDWQGNAKYLLKIPDYLMNISVDEKGGYIYGVDFYNQKILRYNVKKIIKL